MDNLTKEQKKLLTMIRLFRKLIERGQEEKIVAILRRKMDTPAETKPRRK